MAETAASAPSTPFSPRAGFAALDQVRTSGFARWFGRFLLLLVIVLPIAVLFVPWQQSARGRGQVVAYSPTERKQVVTAMVSGQVKTWHVWEQKRVKVGDPIADIDDNDPGLAERLQNQKKQLQERLEAARQEVTQQTGVVTAQEKAMTAAMEAADANLLVAIEQPNVRKETKKNNEARYGYLKVQFESFDSLYRNARGLESGLNRDRAKADMDAAATDVKRAQVEILQAEEGIKTAKALVARAKADGQSSVANANSALQRAIGSLNTIEGSIQELDTRIARYEARFVKSPCDGVVMRVSANSNAGQFVKEGEELAVIVPDTTERVVELMLDGVDAPLVAAFMEQNGGVGPHVRLQFEGWPAVQFVGWPSVAVGTFGGRVRQMDPSDDGNGKFRVLIEPDPAFEGDVWPEGLYLRQGNQAVGWVFLNRVTMGFELWRVFNGFPPMVAPKAPDNSEKKDKKDGKPPKVKT